MKSIFEYDHHFVVFHPGCGGNFVTRLISKLKEQDLEDINVSNTGSCHVLSSKSNEEDYISFGSVVSEQEKFNSYNERVDFYCKHIEQLERKSHTTWTHDFTNIPLYNKFFPNSKILVITSQDQTEKLASLFMHITKTFFDPNPIVPFSDERWSGAVGRVKLICTKELIDCLGFQHRKEIEKIVNDWFNPEYNNFLKYFTYKLFTKYYALNQYLDDYSERRNDLVNYVLYPFSTNAVAQTGRSFNVGKHYNDYIDNNCLIIPYRTFINCDVKFFTEQILKFFDNKLSTDEINFVKKSFLDYVEKQNKKILLSPKSYYYEIQQSALLDLEQLKLKYKK